MEIADLLRQKYALETDEKYLAHLKAIKKVEEEIKKIQRECPHSDCLVVREGTEFDGYDRNEYFVVVQCQCCGLLLDTTWHWDCCFGGKSLEELPRKPGIVFERI